MDRGRIIAVMNGKGGVGKTTISANLAGLCAAAGYRVLAVDLDPQGNLGTDLGYLARGLSDEGRELQEAGIAGRAPKPIPDVRKNLDVIAGGAMLHDLAALLQARKMNSRGGTDTLADAIKAAAVDYDLVIVDCPPGSDVLQIAALEAARWVLIPTKTDDASRAGLREVAHRFQNARLSNPDLQLLGVVFFGVTRSAKRVFNDARAALIRDLGGMQDVLLSATIGHAEALAYHARSRGELVHELERDAISAPRWYERLNSTDSGQTPAAALPSSASSVAGDFQRLADLVLARIVLAESAEGASA